MKILRIKKSKVRIVELNGSGIGILVSGCRSKRERSFVIKQVEKAFTTYRLFYKIRNSVH